MEGRQMIEWTSCFMGMSCEQRRCEYQCQLSLSTQNSEAFGLFLFFPFSSDSPTITQSISGCFSRMCCPMDPSVPQDFPHSVTWQMYFRSISFAHLRTLRFLSSVSSLEQSSKEAIRSASSRFSYSARRSWRLRLLLVVVSLPISAAQKLMACSMLPSKELMETSSSGEGEGLTVRDYSLMMPGMMMTLLLVPSFRDALLMFIIQLKGKASALGNRADQSSSIHPKVMKQNEELLVFDILANKSKNNASKNCHSNSLHFSYTLPLLPLVITYPMFFSYFKLRITVIII